MATKKTKKQQDPMARAQALRAARLKTLLKRDRLKPCLDTYDELVASLRAKKSPAPEVEAMSHLTSILRGTYASVQGQIKAAGKTGIGAINAIKRSAGTNFQGLCEYSILRWLETTDLPVAIGTNSPNSMRGELTIHGIDADAGDFKVEPDIDISLWIPNDDEKGPVIFLSAKTSLVDRAGQAARWKLYLDLHQTTCTHKSQVADCPIHRTGVKMQAKRKITHAIVTANIYKMDTTQPYGELESGQCRNNTYMFKHKFTTRSDSVERRPASWSSFSDFPSIARKVFESYAGEIQDQPMAPQVRLEPIVFFDRQL